MNDTNNIQHYNQQKYTSLPYRQVCDVVVMAQEHMPNNQTHAYD